LQLLLLGLALALLVPNAAPSPVDGATGVDDKTLFARPYIMRVMEPDPWMGGAWFATDGGVFFKDLDSGTVHIYSISDGLPSAAVQDVSVGPTQVWIATLGGVVVLDKATNTVHGLHASDGSAYTYPTRTVFLEGGVAWLGTDNFGLFKVDAATLVVTAAPNPVDGTLFSKPIYGLGAVGDDLYISVYGYGLVRWDRQQDKAWKYDYSYNHQGDPRYFRLYASPSDVWVGTDGDGVMRLRRDTWSFIEYASPQTTNDVTVLAPTVIGDQVWFATKAGAARYDGSTDTWASWNDVLPGDAANDIALVDGQVYAATAGGKVARYDASSRGWSDAAWWEQDRAPQYNLINGCQVDDGRLLFATGGGGADFYDQQTGVWSRAGQEPTDQGTLRDIFVYHTASDSAKRYFATNIGVTEMDKASGQYQSYYTRDGPSRVSANSVRDVEIQGNAVWFATHSSQARVREGLVWSHGNVARMDRQTHAMTFYGTAAGLTDENLTRAVPDGDRVWLGMEHGGLDVLDQKTGTIQHVYTGQGNVHDILVRPDGVWLAAGLDGLLRLDPATLTVTRVPVLDGVAVWTLLDQGSTIWIGTAYKGLFALDPTSLQVSHYGTGLNIDYVANCMAVHQGILYFGTGWGVERFDLAAHRFLPQSGRLPSGAAELGEASSDGTVISIDQPVPDLEVDPGSTLVLAGHASAPSGSQVTFRVGDGPWQAADGVQQWSASVDIPDQVGPVTLSARIERDGAALAQVDRTVYAGMDASQAEALSATAAELHHTPQLEADANEPLLFQVDGAQGLPNATARLEIRKPGADSFQTFPMVKDANGTFTAELPPIGVAGQAEYRILAQWDGGSTRFPELFSSFGPAYPLEVNGQSGGAAVVTGKTSFLMPAAGPAHFDLMVQNPGVRSALFNVRVAGVPASWVKVPASLLIEPSSSKALPVDVLVPDGQKEGRYSLELTLAPASGASATQVHVGLLVPASGASAGHSMLSPLPVWPVLVAVIAVAALRRR
jgi:ligand-binding sensor domain-containing protein